MQNLGGKWEIMNYSKLRFYGVFISNHVNLITFLPHRALCHTETIIYLESKGPELMVGWLVRKRTWGASAKRSLEKRWHVLTSLVYSTINALCCSFDLSDVSHMRESPLFSSAAWVCSLNCALFVGESCLKKKKHKQVDSLYLIYVTPGRKQFIYLRGSRRVGKWQGQSRHTISSGE